MMPERKQSFQSHGIVQTCRLPCLLSHCRHLLLPISIRLNPQKSWKKCDHHIQIFKTSESDQKLFRRMWYDLLMKTSAREQPGYEWKPLTNPRAGIETFVSVHLGWSTSGMSVSMLRQTSLLQCCHFSSLPSASCVLGQPIIPSSLSSSTKPSPTKLTLYHPMFPVRDPELHSDASLCPNTVAEDDIHLTSHSRKSINRFLFFPFHYYLVLLISSLCSSLPSLTPHPSLFGLCLFYFFISYPVKWPYQVPRYVSDAAPHVPTLRFGKEMSAKSRLQGRPSSSSTFFPVLDNLSPIGVNSSQCLCSAVFPRLFC